MPKVSAQDSLNSKRSIHEGRTVLNVSNVNFTVPIKSWGRTVGEKHILKNVSMTMHSGEAMAIMGPSGAGKTTFMDLLTLQGSGGTRTGSVDLNYEPLTPELLRKHCAYVPQNDNGWPFLTCRESIQFAADFSVAGSSQVRRDRVDHLVKSMGLESCQHNKVGNEFMKGLSGGQRRRLSLAIAFLKDPLVVFLDEVTSGLDAASAASIAGFLQELASKQDVIIACTIHQPSARIFQGFKQLLLLSGGRVAYSGKTSDALDHFASLGVSIPEQENPADFFLDSVNGDFTEQSQVNQILDSWEARPVLRMSGSFAVNPLEGKHQKNLCTQFQVMLRRMVLLAWRDPVVYTSRMVVFTVACIFFALVYIKSRARQQDQAFNRVWLILWCMGVPNMMSLAACLGQNLEFVSIKREVKAGMYSLTAYVGAQFVIQIPLLFVLSAIAIGPSGFGIGNWNGNAYPQMWLIHCLSLLSFEFAAQFFAVLFAHPLLGLFQVIQFWFASFLFAGFLVPVDDTPWPLKVFSYISPLNYAVKAMVWSEMQGTSWEGAVLDNSTEGYSCPGHSFHECFGVTGEQVLESMQKLQFKSLARDDETLQDCLILLAIVGTFKLLYVIMAAIQCRDVNAVQPSAVTEKASAGEPSGTGAGSEYAMP
jgi:ABC-type multidrug transport system ATPase subunit